MQTPEEQRNYFQNEFANKIQADSQYLTAALKDTSFKEILNQLEKDCDILKSKCQGFLNDSNLFEDEYCQSTVILDSSFERNENEWQEKYQNKQNTYEREAYNFESSNKIKQKELITKIKNISTTTTHLQCEIAATYNVIHEAKLESKEPVDFDQIDYYKYTLEKHDITISKLQKEIIAKRKQKDIQSNVSRKRPVHHLNDLHHESQHKKTNNRQTT